ncbi:3322_t:CDS:2, partial [Gigaspora margarita]
SSSSIQKLSSEDSSSSSYPIPEQLILEIKKMDLKKQQNDSKGYGLTLLPILQRYGYAIY